VPEPLASRFDLPGLLRRIRRCADLSQRELARSVGVSKSTIAAAETGAAGLDSRVLARAAALASLRLVLVDPASSEVGGMSGDAVRDMANRRYPAHLDIRHGDDRWWHDGEPRYGQERPWYTFDRDRGRRDAFRRDDGTPDDHQLPQPGDAPRERAAARRREYWRSRARERERRFLAGEFAEVDATFLCSCPPGCDELDVGERPRHAPECACSCDLG
jgi:transcriptional regulator with XRE-family HTH domain